MDNVLTSVVNVSVRWNDSVVDAAVNGTQGGKYNDYPLYPYTNPLICAVLS